MRTKMVSRGICTIIVLVTSSLTFANSISDFSELLPPLSLAYDPLPSSSYTFAGTLARLPFPSGRNYPLGVTLQSQVTVREQKYGACHIFAATSSVQAACFRKTGRLFEISEGFLFYRHLREAAEDSKSVSFLKVVFDTLFSENDAGAFSTSLDRIKRGEVYLDSDFSMADLDLSLNRAKQTRREYRNLPSWEKKDAEAAYEARMRRELIDDMDAAFFAKTARRPADSALQACAPSQLKTRYLPKLSPEGVVRLINAAFPVICQFHDSPPSSSSHVYVLVGYRANPLFLNGFEVSARDSTKLGLVTYERPFNCYSSAVVYAPEEEARLDEALKFETF